MPGTMLWLGDASVDNVGSEKASRRRSSRKHRIVEWEAFREGALPHCSPHSLTMHGHLVEPVGLAHLIAGHTLELGCVLRAGG